MKFTTKPTGPHANFYVPCDCGGEITVSNGRLDPHTCRTSADRRQLSADWQEAMADYYDSGAIGAPPKHPLDDRK